MTALSFGIELGYKLSSKQMMFILNPCHILTMIQVCTLASFHASPYPPPLPLVNRLLAPLTLYYHSLTSLNLSWNLLPPIIIFYSHLTLIKMHYHKIAPPINTYKLPLNLV